MTTYTRTALKLSAPALCVFVFMSSAQALDVIATAGAGGHVQDIDATLRLARARDVRDVFSPDEQQMLNAAGRSNLAGAKKFSVSSKRALIELDRLVLIEHLPVKLEQAEIEFQLDGPRPLQSEEEAKAKPGASFEGLQWALKNVGQAIPIALDDLTSLFVTGKPGEDLGIEKAPKELADPKHRITIAVLDTGVDFGHPEFLDRVVENTAECRAMAAMTKCQKDAEALATTAETKTARAVCDSKYAGKDFDGNGYPLDCSGWNVTAKSLVGDRVWGNADARDLIGHGTHVAGIIAARSNDGEGVRGVMDNVRILPVKVITAAPTAPIRPKEVGVIAGARSDLAGVPLPAEPPPAKLPEVLTAKGLGDVVARGLLYAIRSGAQVVNMSLGWPVDVDSNLMRQMVELARSRGILLVAAAGNDGTDALIRPCVFDGMICVASHDPDGAISHFSNYGAGVDIAAPGLNILSTYPLAMSPRVFTDRVGYDLKNGTSMATPFIAGLLGRLLNQGLSPDEARARLLIGARPIAVNPRVKRAHELIVQSGNADLARAFNAVPQPLILPVAKRPIEINWDRRAKKLPFKFALENAWTEAKLVKVQIRLGGRAGRDAQIEPSTLEISDWKAGETKNFDLQLGINSDRLESEFTAELIIMSVDAKSGRTSTNKRFTAIGIVSTPLESDPDVETRKITGDAQLIADLPDSNLRSVYNVDGRNERDYVTLKLIDESTIRVSLLAQDGKSYRFIGSTNVARIKGNLQLVNRVDVDGDGVSDYVLIWKQVASAEKQMPTFIFRYFDSHLRPLQMTFDGKTSNEFEFSNSVSVISENFQWISAGKGKVPAWVTRGTTPELEKKPYDPWNPSPLDLPDFRVYVWSEKGLVTIPLGDKIPVGFFPPTREEMGSGRRRLMLMTGEGTDATYEMSVVTNLTLATPTALDLGGFRKVRSTMMAPLLSLAPNGSTLAGETLGVGIYGDSYRSASRVTGFFPNEGSGQRLVFDKVLEPSSKVDSVLSVLGGFSGARNTSVISQTIYEMQYDDIQSGEKASASLKRFSFMPDFYFDKLYRPVLGEDRQNSVDRLPMAYLAQGFGTGSALEVIAPRYESGKLVGFARPARLHLTAPAGCQSMEDTVEAAVAGPTKVVFACHDRIMFVPLKY